MIFISFDDNPRLASENTSKLPSATERKSFAAHRAQRKITNKYNGVRKSGCDHKLG